MKILQVRYSNAWYVICQPDDKVQFSGNFTQLVQSRLFTNSINLHDVNFDIQIMWEIF
jgi:hypothetical protein